MNAPVTPADWSALTDELSGFVGRRVPPSDVDDVVQDVLLRVHAGVASRRDGGNFGAWMTRVARNAIADHFRARGSEQRRREGLRLDPAVGRSDRTASPDAPADTGTSPLSGCVRRLVRELPDTHREALLLTEVDGLTQREAAERLGISVSGMKSRVQRARASLRAHVEACCSVALDARNGVLDVSAKAGGCGGPDACRCA